MTHILPKKSPQLLLDVFNPTLLHGRWIEAFQSSGQERGFYGNKQKIYDNNKFPMSCLLSLQKCPLNEELSAKVYAARASADVMTGDFEQAGWVPPPEKIVLATWKRMDVFDSFSLGWKAYPFFFLTKHVIGICDHMCKTKRSLLYLYRGGCMLHIFAGTTSQGLLTESLISSELRDTERRLKNLAVYGRSL